MPTTTCISSFSPDTKAGSRRFVQRMPEHVGAPSCYPLRTEQPISRSVGKKSSAGRLVTTLVFSLALHGSCSGDRTMPQRSETLEANPHRSEFKAPFRFQFSYEQARYLRMLHSHLRWILLRSDPGFASYYGGVNSTANPVTLDGSTTAHASSILTIFSVRCRGTAASPPSFPFPLRARWCSPTRRPRQVQALGSTPMWFRSFSMAASTLVFDRLRDGAPTVCWGFI
ncbi:hypothetical protein K466DRAFT_1625 [Polyporus arcularius HHB13444]|uniref:Uncharacterized protein n=1 Tax=Polyporus arcularius HHB13444 TaxID=1314778 RepID=A0A5C3Q3L9_9APHY|nr:hypothetical protein K466DRAFT_1625 [Polyporus arcularius HHB13444]